METRFDILPKNTNELADLAEKIAINLMAKKDFLQSDFFYVADHLCTTLFIDYINQFFLYKLCHKYLSAEDCEQLDEYVPIKHAERLYEFDSDNNPEKKLKICQKLLNNIQIDEYYIAAHLFLRIKALQAYAIYGAPAYGASNNYLSSPATPGLSLYFLKNTEQNQLISNNYGLPDIEIILFDILTFKLQRDKYIWISAGEIIQIIDSHMSKEQQENSYLTIFLHTLIELKDSLPVNISSDNFIKLLLKERLLPMLASIPFDNQPYTIAIERLIKILNDWLPKTNECHFTLSGLLGGKNRNCPDIKIEENIYISSDQYKAIEKIKAFKFKRINNELSNIFKMQLLRRVLNPALITLNNSKVCGVEVYFQFIAKHDPFTYVSMAIDLIDKGKCTSPFLIKNKYKQDKLENIILIDDLLLSSFRNQKNTIPYNKEFPDIIKSISGVTFSYEIVDWITNKNSENKYKAMDTTIFLDKNSQPLSKFQERFFQIYSPKRVKFDDHKINLINAVNCFNSNSILIMLITHELDYLLQRGKKWKEQADTLLGIEYTHYINISHIALHEDCVKITGTTSGNHFQRVIGLEDFLAGYRGAIIIDENLKLRNTNSNPSSLSLFQNEVINKKSNDLKDLFISAGQIKMIL